MDERWELERVLALAPDAASRRAARSLRVHDAGAADAAVWGQCQGSARTPYQTVVDLTGPAYHCSCPSRKFPCKHAVAVLLQWSDGAVAEAVPPAWAATWLHARRTRIQNRAAKAEQSGADTPETLADAEPGTGPAPGAGDPAAARERRAQREARVRTGLMELDRWLCDDLRRGLAAAQQSGYEHWDEIAARMVDSQASALADRLRDLAALRHSGSGWETRMLEEYALIRLLATAYQRRAELPADLGDTVRARIGFTQRKNDVLVRGTRVRDRWHVLGRRDESRDRVRTRRTWLRGSETGRTALVLSFAANGETLDDSLRVGTHLTTELAFYPGAAALRALVLEPAAGAAHTHGPQVHTDGPGPQLAPPPPSRSTGS
jgi:hypothetical protein